MCCTQTKGPCTLGSYQGPMQLGSAWIHLPWEPGRTSPPGLDPSLSIKQESPSSSGTLLASHTGGPICKFCWAPRTPLRQGGGVQQTTRMCSGSPKMHPSQQEWPKPCTHTAGSQQQELLWHLLGSKLCPSFELSSNTRRWTLS